MEGFLRKHCQPESQLLDKLMLSSSLAPRTTENYLSYLPKNDIEAGIRSGTYYRGYLNSRTSSWDSCYIIVNDQGNRKSILVEGKTKDNRRHYCGLFLTSLFFARRSECQSRNSGRLGRS